ncbi:D-alanyl-D-alanine carboxypeptidase/D-alanyl-D-alanine-endopeptidase [Zoogloea sp.]|uniref:D-alanyl-D-alanine carboxypeptidase/D-alanyl-D-alanine endopeptidase n=1 Tax=Zoogloea sp. TaxID=49181 RepID=UPI0026095C28|nr:D-alanyl-D-alanine carboxypeptidase/D-alanyl-D-alanine-endopeptidase [Zoogloea sp.]MDD3353163.1 D-alanyl-D-alanine carboxypeptidase/D-alanyl-D-alanine-endopeptidase [Zoogloea sp.]
MRTCCTLLAALLSATPAARATDTWPHSVETSLRDNRIPDSAVSLLVLPVDGAKPLIAHRADEAMTPASVMKVVTAWAALENLGPAHVWQTRLLASEAQRDGVLTGNLHIVGGGDPRLSRERLWQMLRDLRMRGVQRIAGDVLIDRSVFRLPPHDPAAFDQRPLRPYNMGADALQVDYGALPVRLTPTPTGARILMDPPFEGLQLESQVQRSGGVCADPTAGLGATTERTGSGITLRIEGTLPEACTQDFVWNLSPVSPTRLFEALFRSLWHELGGEIDGQFRDAPAPSHTTLLTESPSPPLAEVIRDMNKWSNNVIARHLLATLGNLEHGDEDSVSRGVRKIVDTLRSSGISTAGLVIENGSGLSRRERISARSLAQVLQHAWRGRHMPELLASLPIAGVDGTARKRFAGTPASGNAHIKTGTLDGVRSLAGYVLGVSGRRYIVVMMINHTHAAASREAQNLLLEWVARH